MDDMKTYFFPNDDICEDFFGSSAPVCVDRKTVEWLSREWEDPDLMEHMHEATNDELEEYGTGEED